jgi:hypothetical protein
VLLFLHGAKKNAGDYLIRERGIAIVRHLRPQQEIVVHDRWRPLPREALDRADAIVLGGGPGLATNFYPGIFPLVPDLESVKTPIFPLALGWSGRPAKHPERFRFDEPSLAALRSIHERIGWSGVRDDLSLQVVRDAEVGEARRTGCFAWYDLSRLGEPLHRPERVRSLVFTPPAFPTRKESLDSLALLRLLRSRYRHAERFCVFHRGIRPGTGTPLHETVKNSGIAALARALGYRIVDASHRLEALEFYGDSDLHVGYRVHAHLLFLSQRRPSVLISQDGRGAGQSRTLHDASLIWSDEPDVPERTLGAVAEEERAGFPSSEAAVEEIERSWPVMKETVEQLPAG